MPGSRTGYPGMAALRRTGIVAVLTAALFVAGQADAAGDSDGSAAAAESMFQEGRKMMDAKRYSEACPKFAASQKIAPAIGTLLNLADCYEKNGQLASAWARFHEAIALAQRLGRTNREQTARERADKLEPRLTKLTIMARTSGIEVKLDGNPLDSAVLSTPIPVDAGKHTLEATAKDKKPFIKDFEVTEKVKNPSVEIPPLEDDPQAKAAKEAKETGEAKEKKEPKPADPRKEDRGGWPVQKTVGVVIGGVGVVALGVGAFFGIKTRSTWSEAQRFCTADLLCEPDGVTLANEARTSGNIATVGLISGGVLLVGGAVLFLTAPSHRKASASSGSGGPLRVGVGPGSLLLKGEF